VPLFKDAQEWSERGQAAWSRFKQSGQPADLDAAIACFRSAVAVVPANDALRAQYIYHLVCTLHLRFQRALDRPSLDEAITAAREAVALDPAHVGYHSALSALLQERFRENNSLADLDDAIASSRAAITLRPTQSSDGSASLANLGSALQTRFGLIGSLDDLEDAISLKRTALTLSQPAETRKGALLDLAMALTTLAELSGRPETLAEAVSLARRAVWARPREGREQANCLAILGWILEARSARSGAGALEDLAEALSCVRTAIGLTPAGHPDQAKYLGQLVTMLALQTRLTGDSAPVNEAVRVAREASAEALGWTGEPVRGDYPFVLMTALRLRYDWAGKMADLDEAAAVGRAGAAISDERPVTAFPHAALLADVLFLRHRQAGSTADLDLAIALHSALTEANSHDPRRLARDMSSLGMLLCRRFQQTQDEHDLEVAVALGREAVAATLHQRDEPVHLFNVANALVERFRQDGHLADLDEAVEMTRRATDAPGGGPLREARCCSTLAHALTLRFRKAGRPEDIEQAIDAGRRSIALVAARNPERSGFLARLGDALRTRFELTGDPNDRAAAVAAHVEAAAIDTAPARQRVSSARAAAADLAAASDPGAAADLLAAAVRMFPEVSPRRLARGDQQHALRGAGYIAAEAASLLLADSRVPEADRPERALGLLEAGRAVLISQALDGRDDLSELNRQHPDLAERFAELRNQLDTPGEPGLPDPMPSSRDGLGISERALGDSRDRQSLAAEFAATLSRIRELDGFGSFGLPPTAPELLAAAERGPVVMFNVTRYGSHALLVTGTGVAALPLPGLDEETLITRVTSFVTARHSITTVHESAQVRRGEATIISALEWLWDVAAGPVLEALGFLSSPVREDDWPRIWWIPSGVLSLLPVHAAGYHFAAADGQPPSTVIDRVVSSYAPSVRALLHTRRRIAAPAAAGTPRALVVAMASTPGLSGNGPLPNIPKEVEALRRHFPGLTVLDGSDGRADGSTAPVKAAVLARLADHPIAHFACHGSSDPLDPSRSKLLLEDHADDPLTVASLASVSLDRAQLAYLSACSTATTYSSGLFDESIHLASAFQLAGYPHVISTMWEINDQFAVIVADGFYAHLRDKGGALRVCRAAYALHRAVRAARERTNRPGYSDAARSPLLWAAYIHVGP
jgi:tetratricopeptide (TPR) repeat protein